MYLLDSSVWVALFLDNDSLHKKAVSLIEQIEQIDNKIYMPYCVILEVVTVLTYKHSKEQANNFLNYIEKNTNIILIENQLYSEINFFKNNIQEKISFVDASLIFLSIKMNLALVTFDSKLIKIIKKFINPRNP